MVIRVKKMFFKSYKKAEGIVKNPREADKISYPFSIRFILQCSLPITPLRIATTSQQQPRVMKHAFSCNKNTSE